MQEPTMRLLHALALVALLAAPALAWPKPDGPWRPPRPFRPVTGFRECTGALFGANLMLRCAGASQPVVASTACLARLVLAMPGMLCLTVHAMRAGHTCLRGTHARAMTPMHARVLRIASVHCASQPPHPRPPPPTLPSCSAGQQPGHYLWRQEGHLGVPR